MKEKIVYTERVTDAHGIERIYGYTIQGQKYLLNLEKLIKECERRGINNFKRVV